MIPPPRSATVRQVLTLGSPVIVTELAGVSFSTIDILIVGRLGPEALAAVGMGNLLFIGLGGFGVGFFFCLDALVAQAYGARRIVDCHRWLVHAIVAAIGIAALLWVAARVLIGLLPVVGLAPTLQALVVPYLEVVSWSYLPQLLFMTCRRYLQAMSVVRPTSVAMVSAVGVTALANWALVFGELGAPALGSTGSAWAACITRSYLFLFMASVVIAHALSRDTGLFAAPRRLDGERLLVMARLGIPAGFQFGIEIGVFAAAAALAGRLDPVAAAAHQIAFSVASMTFVVTLGIAGAGAVLVGQGVGRRDPGAVRRTGWTALVLAAGFMAAVAVVFLLFREQIVGLYTSDAEVVAAGAAVLLVAASFQVVDGTQVVATAILRGVGDTRTPMLTHLVAHWLIGLPLGTILCFPLGLGVVGLWIGLSAGLAVVAITLVVVWARRLRALEVRLLARARAPGER